MITNNNMNYKMKKWIIGGVVLIVFLTLGLIIWFKIKGKKKVKELDPHLQELAKEIAEGKDKETSKEEAINQQIYLQQEKINQLEEELRYSQQKIMNLDRNKRFEIVENPILKTINKEQPSLKNIGMPTNKREKTEAETKAWEKAKATNTIQAYQDFLRGEYGSKVCFGTAKSMMNRLIKAQSNDNE